jgi:hypothetical protein
MLTSAQIPNSNFENWSFGTWSLEPDGWVTPNNQLETFVVQDQNAYEGDYAMRVIALPVGVGKFGSASTTVPIDYIPASLDFYVRCFVESGMVSVSIAFYNEEFLFNSFEWDSFVSIDEWTPVTIPMEQNEPVLTHAVISVEAFVGDFSPGEAEISVDAMGFGGVTNIDDRNKPDMVLYPNPATDQITITGLTDQTEIHVFDALGQAVMAKRVSGPSIQLDLFALGSGLYLVEAETKNGISATKRMVIRK